MGADDDSKAKKSSAAAEGKLDLPLPNVSAKTLEAKLMGKQQFKDLPLDERTEELFARLLDVVPTNSKVGAKFRT